jgi:hypothetical protein
MTRRALAGKSLPGELYPHGLADLHRLDFLIDSEMTLAHTAQVTALHPRTNGLFRTTASRFPPLRPGGCPSRCRLVHELGKNTEKVGSISDSLSA